MEWNDVAGRLTGLSHIATADADGSPHVAVVSHVVDGGTLWIGTRGSSKKARNVAANGRLSLMCEAGAETYVQCAAEIVTSQDDKQRLWSMFGYNPAEFFGSVDDPDFVLIKAIPRSATVMTMGANGPERSTWRA